MKPYNKKVVWRFRVRGCGFELNFSAHTSKQAKKMFAKNLNLAPFQMRYVRTHRRERLA